MKSSDSVWVVGLGVSAINGLTAVGLEPPIIMARARRVFVSPDPRSLESRQPMKKLVWAHEPVYNKDRIQLPHIRMTILSTILLHVVQSPKCLPKFERHH